MIDDLTPWLAGMQKPPSDSVSYSPWAINTKVPTEPKTPGMFDNPFALATVLARLGGAFAPENYVGKTRIPSWQEKLAGQVGAMSQGQQVMKALQAPGSSTPGAGINPMLLMLLLQGKGGF